MARKDLSKGLTPEQVARVQSRAEAMADAAIRTLRRLTSRRAKGVDPEVHAATVAEADAMGDALYRHIRRDALAKERKKVSRKPIED